MAHNKSSYMFVFLTAGLPFAVLNIQHKPFKRGFFCSDSSIKYPFKDDTISYQLLMGIMIPFTLFTVSVFCTHRFSFSLTDCETQTHPKIHITFNKVTYSKHTRVWFYWWCLNTTDVCRPQIIFGECFSVYVRSRASFSHHEYVVCVYKSVGSFVFGAALSQSLTDIAKYSVGRLRPHFLTVCKPDWSLIDCSSGYIENVTCTGDPRINSEARWPLPSLQI